MSFNISDSVWNDLFEVDFNPHHAMKFMAIVCTLYFAEHPTTIEPGVVYCNSTFDSFSCWPATRAGEVANVACPDISITDPNSNATKECFENGTWAAANYAVCMRKRPHSSDPLDTMYVPRSVSVRIIYDVGFAVTAVALIIALAIFLRFKSLRCLRNSIHCNLFLAFILSNLTWLIVNKTLNNIYSDSPEWTCKLLIAVTTYFHTTTFYWMFVEGIYLLTIVVWAFSAQKQRLWYYFIVGWGAPLIGTSVWVVVKEHVEKHKCWLHTGTYVDLIIHVPVLFLLGCNVLFLVAIIWILVTKMKSSNSLENRQTTKAVKATVVLVPLLGLTYVMFLRAPLDDRVVSSVFQHINAVLQSTQGLFVAVFYCFLNGEVQSCIRQKFNSLQDSRSLSRYTKTTVYGSPRRSSCNLANGNGKHESKALRPAEPENEESILMMDRLTPLSQQTL